VSTRPHCKVATVRMLCISVALLSWTLVMDTLTAATARAGGHASRSSVASEGLSAFGPKALAAGRVYLVENATLHLSGEGETTLSERGEAAGTFDAPLTAHLNLSIGHVTGLFTIYPKGGSISGMAQARYAVRGSVGYYGGTLTITRGTGTYKHASGSDIGISGTINHLTFVLTVKAHGWTDL
jgi:hypothetical protein